MALGRKIQSWGAEEMARGVSTSSEFPDGGFSPETTAVNLVNTPGVCFQPAKSVDKSTNVIGEIIASCEDPQLSGEDRVFVDDEGHYYSWNGTTMSLDRTDATNPSGYSQGVTDMNAYDGSTFATTNTTVVKWTVNSVFTDNFITGLTSGVPHPLLTYEGNQYIGNANVLKRMTSASDSTAGTVLTLPTNQNIIALGIDPGSGKMLISTTQGLNISDTISNTNKVLYYDGYSNKVDKVVQVDDMVTAFPFSSGQLYVAYGHRLGYWNGAGITFLKNFTNIGYDNTQLLYKQHFANIGSTLYMIVRSKIFAHGPIQQGGSKVFYPAFYNKPDGVETDLTHIAHIGQGNLGLAYATDKFFTFSTTSVSTAQNQLLVSNSDDFPEFNDGAWVRRFRIILKNEMPSGYTFGYLRLYNQDGLVEDVGNSGIITLANTTGTTSAMLDVPIGGGTGLRFYHFIWEIEQFNSTASENPGIVHVYVFGDEANKA